MHKTLAIILVTTFLHPLHAQDRGETEAPAPTPVPEWTKLPKAQPDYLPPGFRFVEFPPQEVGRIYLAKKTDSGWQIRRDSYPYSSLAKCRVALAKGRVALPTDQPLFLETSAEDLSFLEPIDKKTFVAIEATRSDGSLVSVSKLI